MFVDQSTGTIYMGGAFSLWFGASGHGGVHQAPFGGAMVLSDPAVLPASISTYLGSVRGAVASTAIFDGTSTLSTSVEVPPRQHSASQGRCRLT